MTRRSLVLAAVLFAALSSRAARSDAPPTRYAITDETVTDRRTGLTWERTLSEGGYTWDAAKAYCETLTIAGGPWRLPTLKELLTIVDPTRAQPALDPVAFPDAPIDATWSASPYVRETNWYYLVYFNLGFSGYTSSGALHRVRCVH